MKMRSIFLVISLLALSATSQARDDKLLMPISAAMTSAAAQEQLNPDIKFYFGKDSAKYTSKIGTYTANRKTNAFNKSDEVACQWVFLSALLALQDRAVQQGGNAVVDIHSDYKKNPMFSAENYECHAGAIMAGVALRGTVVKQ
ncbi:MAG: excinuclease ATPase subunit [Gammaproteobacteria bacterium]|nr:MAG: excinuclease ATPase subunit [Gammaproteobacteria bacterium]RLA12712.1 MAG: excinuclease ATPase subunit [Gammaproteobacteria bacterium]RLA16670.1 MAG: excinuclease ATPase subunit [Gammaproteobacteria bacterium]